MFGTRCDSLPHSFLCFLGQYNETPGQSSLLPQVPALKKDNRNILSKYSKQLHTLNSYGVNIGISNILVRHNSSHAVKALRCATKMYFFNSP